MADLHDPAETGQSFLIDFLASEEVRIVEEVAQKPSKLPKSFSSAIHTSGDGPAGKHGGFQDREAKVVERLLGVPTVLGLVDSDKEHTVGNLIAVR
jgi:hypothetical protein